MTQTLSIGQLSGRTACNVETIRYYERVNLLPTAVRSPNGYRRYSAADVKHLTFIRRSRELGFSIGEIRELLTCVDEQNHTQAEVKAVTLAHLAEVRQKIEDLQRLEQTLTKIAKECHGDDGPADACPILDALFSGSELPQTQETNAA